MMMPETFRTAHGLTVAGAGPELLRDLLADFESELAKQEPECVAAMRPGLAREEVISALRGAGVPVSEELVVWWGWHDGVADGFTGGPPLPQASLSAALKGMAEDIPDYSGLPAGSWVPLRWVGGEGIAARFDASLGATVVRHFEPGWEFVLPEPPLDQAISLCTPVTWWIRALRDGWQKLENPDPFPPWWAQTARYPLDWQYTHLL